MPVVPRTSFLSGARAALPLSLPVIPVGLVLGVVVNETEAVSKLAGAASAPLVLGGASQLAAISLLATGAGAFSTALTVAVINARHVMYSARLQASFGHLPLWFRIVAPYMLLDQVFAVTELAAAEDEPSVSDEHRMGRYLGAGFIMVSLWFLAVALGVTVGSVLPDDWSLDFSVPLLFLGLLVLSVTNRPGVVAAVVGGSVAVAGNGLPNGTGLLAGAVLGVGAGGLVDWLLERNAAATQPTGTPDRMDEGGS